MPSSNKNLIRLLSREWESMAVDGSRDENCNQPCGASGAIPYLVGDPDAPDPATRHTATLAPSRMDNGRGHCPAHRKTPPMHLPTPWPYPRWIAHRGAGLLAPENTPAPLPPRAPPPIPLPPPGPSPRWMAPRGAGLLAPETPLAAFRLGARHGYRMFECDAKLSRDGVPFLLHDTTLERTTNNVQALGPGASRTGGDHRWSALSRLDAGAWHSPGYAGDPPPP